MIKNILAVLLLVSSLTATETTTEVKIVDFPEHTVDKYGSYIYKSEVTITTKNYKVDNFWKKFSFSGKGQDKMEFTNISKKGTVEISVEATSLCTLYPELDKSECSGQKPFVINNEALSSPLNSDGTITLTFQKDYNGASILYKNDNNNSFYPLDVDREGEYTTTDTLSPSCHSFFCTVTKMFDGFFGSSFFSKFYNLPTVTTETDLVRKRYISNITAGLDQAHLIEKEITPLHQTKNQHDPVSFIDYTESTTKSGNCNLGFFSFSETNTFCNIMGGMPFIRWFASKEPTQQYTVDTIHADTENAIIAFAGTYEGLNVTTYESKVKETLDADHTPKFLPLKIMKNFMCMIMPFMNCDEAIEEKTNIIKDSYYTFDENNATLMTFAVTNNGSKIDDFKTFKLLRIHSIVGDGKISEDSSCDKVIKTWEICMPMMGCIGHSETAITSPSSSECEMYKDGVRKFGKTWSSVNYVEGATTMNVSGRLLSLDLKPVSDLNRTSEATTLRYKLTGTN